MSTSELDNEAEIDSETEFQVIQRFFTKNKNNYASITKGIGDDAAVIDISNRSNLLISMDTLISGVHFPVHTKPADIAYKSLAVNLSDLAAMGASPAWFTLALTLPKINSLWLSEFSRGLFELADEYSIELVGGDTTQNNNNSDLSITIQIAGYTNDNNIMYRHTARINDDIYVSGYLGDAGAGLVLSTENSLVDNESDDYFLQRLNRPTARVILGEQLRQLDTACIDISDGLLADLAHITAASGCAAQIDVDKLPISAELKNGQFSKDCFQLALDSGDDYELCFCVAEQYQKDIQDISQKLSIPITRIGKIINGQGVHCQFENQVYNYTKTGYQHFTKGC